VAITATSPKPGRQAYGESTQMCISCSSHYWFSRLSVSARQLGGAVCKEEGTEWSPSSPSTKTDEKRGVQHQSPPLPLRVKDFRVEILSSPGVVSGKPSDANLFPLNSINKVVFTNLLRESEGQKRWQ
ncbi:hypothetical protein, partial [Aeromonas piscicola]|uniref:hypothetical protein n=1 Tax=Aeromonas piscicola TaxID=600645 RepID=UPI001AE063FB